MRQTTTAPIAWLCFLGGVLVGVSVRVGEGEIHFSCPLAFVATAPEATTNGNGNSLGCTAMACEEDLVASGCSPETVAAYRRYQRLRGPGGDRLRDCPSCGSLVAARAARPPEDPVLPCALARLTGPSCAASLLKSAMNEAMPPASTIATLLALFKARFANADVRPVPAWN